MLESQRLRLTPMSKEDAPFVFELVNSQGWLEHIGDRNVHSIEDAENYIQEKMINHFTEHGYGNYLLTRKEDECKVGCVSLYNRPDVDGVDIGFAMLEPHYGNGYAYEGAALIKEYAKSQLNFESMCAFTSKDNIASQKLIEKLGLSFTKTILFGEEKEELLYYKMTF